MRPSKKNTRINIAVAAVLISVGVSLVIVPKWFQPASTIKRLGEVPGGTFDTIRNGFLYFRNNQVGDGSISRERNPSHYDGTLYRMALTTQATTPVGKIPALQPRSPAEYVLPSNFYTTSSIGQHYIFYTLTSAPMSPSVYAMGLPPGVSSDGTLPVVFLPSPHQNGDVRRTFKPRHPSWSAIVYTSPWDGSASFATEIAAPPQGRVNILSVRERGVLYTETRSIVSVSVTHKQNPSTGHIESAPDTVLRQVALKPFPRTKPITVTSNLLSNSRIAASHEVVLWDVPRPYTTRPQETRALITNAIGKPTPITLWDAPLPPRVCPEYNEGSLWWLDIVAGKLFYVAPGSHTTQVVEPPLRSNEGESIKYEWLKGGRDGLYLCFDIAAAGDSGSNETGRVPASRTYMLRLHAGQEGQPPVWGTPIILPSTLANTQQVFFEKGRAYFICSENSRTAVAELLDVFSSERHEPMVDALYCLPLPK